MTDYKKMWEVSHETNAILIQENKRLKARINRIIKENPKLKYSEPLEKKRSANEVQK